MSRKSETLSFSYPRQISNIERLKDQFTFETAFLLKCQPAER